MRTLKILLALCLIVTACVAFAHKNNSSQQKYPWEFAGYIDINSVQYGVFTDFETGEIVRLQQMEVTNPKVATGTFTGSGIVDLTCVDLGIVAAPGPFVLYH